MSRKIAALLALIFIFTLAIPLQGFAAEMDKELEDAIKIVRTKFSIPDDYKFTSSISTSETSKVYYLSWRSNDSLNMSSISATVDDKGNILDYNKYSPDDYKQNKKLPSVSREEARIKANAYIEHITPGLSKEIVYQDNYQDSIMDSSYYLQYYRIVNGVPYYNDRVSVSINRETGDLQGYYRNWSTDLEFSLTKGSISLEEAEAAYAKHLGLKLIYGYTANEGILSAFPLYAPIYDNNEFAINAFTGERYRLSLRLYFTEADGGYGASVAKDKFDVRNAAGVQLSPEELEAVGEAAKLIDEKEAEKIARESEFINISDDYELQSYHLNTSWPDEKEYIWSLYFRRTLEDKKLGEEFISVSINAKTGLIFSFYRNSADSSDEQQPVNDIAKARAVTDAFLSKYYPQYYKLLEYDRVANEEYLMDKTVPSSFYNIRYTRLVEGVPFPDNGVSFSYDNLTGEITSFSLNWFEIEFPSVDNVIELTAAVDSLFEKVGLGLEYRYESPSEASPMMLKEGQASGKTSLVYLLKPGKPLYIDALTGNVVYRTGEKYTEAKSISYTDIKDHFAEKQISVLAEFGIYLEGSEFRPSEAITQKDFLAYLSKTLNYYGPIITEKSTQKEIDEMYAYLIRDGIIAEGEKSPDSVVTREEAVKYIIRTLKYDKVADISGIFNIDFKDSASISEDLYGYVAIASGLGIVSGDGTNFYPKRNISRGESAVIIYNYLQQ
jgi:hypothetical protein